MASLTNFFRYSIASCALVTSSWLTTSLRLAASASPTTASPVRSRTWYGGRLKKHSRAKVTQQSVTCGPTASWCGRCSHWVRKNKVSMADAKSTPAYSSDLHILGIIMQLLDLCWQYWSDLPKSKNCYFGGVKYVRQKVGPEVCQDIALSTFLLLLELFQTYFWTY